MNNSKRWVLVNADDNSLVRSSYRRTEFKQRAAALRQARKLEPSHRCAINVLSLEMYIQFGYDKQTRMVRNAMTGQLVEESINTPWSCSVASETYWCS